MFFINPLNIHDVNKFFIFIVSCFVLSEGVNRSSDGLSVIAVRKHVKGYVLCALSYAYAIVNRIILPRSGRALAVLNGRPKWKFPLLSYSSSQTSTWQCMLSLIMVENFLDKKGY